MNLRPMITALVLCALATPVSAAGLGWEVTADDGRTLYLVGTLHAARESLYPLPESVQRAFADAEALVLEVDTRHVDPAEAARIARDRGRMLQGHTLRDLVSSDAWSRVLAWAHRLGIPERNMLAMQPWLAAVTLVALEMRRIGLDPALGMEHHFATLADERGIPIAELESLAEQLEMLANLSESTQVAFLDHSLAGTEVFAGSVDDIIRNWVEGDTEAMEELLGSSFDGHGELYDTLMRQRNLRWLPVVETMLGSGRTHFVAVGALHMFGADGLVELLQVRGYRVEPL